MHRICIKLLPQTHLARPTLYLCAVAPGTINVFDDWASIGTKKKKNNIELNHFSQTRPTPGVSNQRPQARSLARACSSLGWGLYCFPSL